MTTHYVAVVGTGFIGPVHVEGLRRAGQQVLGILGSSPARSRQAADALGIPRAYDSYEQLLADRDIQAVHITTPNRFHFEMASQAIRAGKHVMCEKPLAMNSRESAKLTRLAATAQVAAGVNYNIRYYPLCLEAAEQVRGGSLGDVFHVTGSYSQDWLFHRTDFNWRVSAAEGGALRAVADIGTHWLDLIYAVTGLEIEAVCADLLTVYPTRYPSRGSVETFSGQASPAAGTVTADMEAINVTTEDYGCIMLRFRGGSRGNVWVSQVSAGRKNCLRFEIAGSRHSLAWNSEQPNSLWIGHRDRANENLLRDPALLGPIARQYADYPGGHNEGFPDTFKQCFRAFYDYIAVGDWQAAPSFPTFADGHREIVACEAILQSHHEQRWVQVAD